MNVEQWILKLQKENPKAVVIWNGNHSCVAHAIDPGVARTKVSDINGKGEIFSTIGPDRNLPAVVIDLSDPP